jgi:hypothetical protein
LVGSFSVQNEFVVEEFTYWTLLPFADIVAWDTSKVYPGSGISEPNVAMFNRGMFHPLSSNAFISICLHRYSLFMLAGGFHSIWEILWCAVCQDVWHMHGSIAGWSHFCNMYCILIHLILNLSILADFVIM